MKRYFTNIKKPKWYMSIAAILFFIVQCSAIIQLVAQFGGGYYLIIPVQLLCGYMDIMLYLMVQKDAKAKGFVINIILSIVCGAAASLLIFDNLFNSVPGVKGVLYGIVIGLTFGMLFFVVLGVARNLLFKKRQAL